MASKIIFVLEGKTAESAVLEPLIRAYGLCNRIELIYGAELYQLYKKVSTEEFVDLIEVLRERNQDNKDKLEGLKRNDLAEIYLFFDYEGHAPEADKTKVEEMLRWFDNETENGKLYISYPMLEAFRHIVEKNCGLTTLLNEGKTYKNLVSSSDSKYGKLDVKRLKLEDWDHIILANLKKVNHIRGGNCNLTSYTDFKAIFTQLEILSIQEKHLSTGNVAVLSALPFFMIDYIGEELYRKFTEKALSCGLCSLATE